MDRQDIITSDKNNDINISINNNINDDDCCNSMKNKSKKIIDGMEMQWTNESHSNFLRLMEASFVRNLIKRSDNNNNTTKITTTTSTTHPRLDRFVPDVSESTLDLHKSGSSSNRVSRTCNRQKERAAIRPYKMSHDQMVPRVVLEDKESQEVKRCRKTAPSIIRSDPKHLEEISSYPSAT